MLAFNNVYQKDIFIIFHPQSHLPVHYSFLSYDKSFVTPQGKMLPEINDNIQMHLKKIIFPFWK